MHVCRSLFIFLGMLGRFVHHRINESHNIPRISFESIEHANLFHILFNSREKCRINHSLINPSENLCPEESFGVGCHIISQLPTS